MDIKIWRYSLPPVDPLEGWGIFLLDSTGMFAAVSDYGNYAFKWTHHGCEDFRDFISRDLWPNYVCGKLARRTEFQEKRTLKGIRSLILKYRRDGYWSKDEARREWALMNHLDFADELDRATWYNETRFVDASDLFEYDYPTDVRMFAERLMPRLAEVIQAELAQERKAA